MLASAVFVTDAHEKLAARKLVITHRAKAVDDQCQGPLYLIDAAARHPLGIPTYFQKGLVLS